MILDGCRVVKYGRLVVAPGLKLNWHGIVAHNLLKDMGVIRAAEAAYNGYGSCPLTVERGRIVFAEFGYGGKLLPTFPTWLIDGQRPSRIAWLLKERMLPTIYWKAMLRGREWLATPELVG